MSWQFRQLSRRLEKLRLGNKTSRDQPKSAPYPRLKNSKKTSKCQVFSFTVLENRKFFERKWTDWRAKVSQCRKTERGDPLRFFNIHSVAKHEKIEGGPFGGKIPKKSLTVPKKTKGGPFGIFQHPFCRKTAKTLKGGPFGEKNSEKSLGVPKKMGRGDPLVSPGMVWYAGKQEKPFWFSSLDQIVQFGAIIFCRTFKNYFGQFVCIEKKSL